MLWEFQPTHVEFQLVTSCSPVVEGRQEVPIRLGGGPRSVLAWGQEQWRPSTWCCTSELQPSRELGRSFLPPRGGGHPLYWFGMILVANNCVLNSIGTYLFLIIGTGDKLSQEWIQAHSFSSLLCLLLLYGCKRVTAAPDTIIPAFPEAPEHNIPCILLSATGSHGLPWFQGRLGNWVAKGNK